MSTYSSGSSSAASPGGTSTWDSSDESRVSLSGTRRVECPLCGKHYASKKSLKIHNRIHTGYKPYKCDLCPKSFSQTNVLKAHKNAHTGQRDWSCPICFKRFTQSAHLRTHQKTHSNRKDFNCVHCEKCFSSKGVRDRHMRQHTGEKPFHCRECHKQFTRGESLRFHMNAHKGIRPYRCSYENCPSTFTKHSSLKRHIKICHSLAPAYEKLEISDLCDKLRVGVEDIPENIKIMTPAELERHFLINNSSFDLEFTDGRAPDGLNVKKGHTESNGCSSTFLPAFYQGDQCSVFENPIDYRTMYQGIRMKTEEDVCFSGHQAWPYTGKPYQLFNNETPYSPSAFVYGGGFTEGYGCLS